MDKEEIERLKEVERKQKERFKKQNQYLKTKYDRLNITVPAGKKAEIEAAAGAAGKSVNAFCSELILNAVNNSSCGDDKQPFPDDELPECFR